MAEPIAVVGMAGRFPQAPDTDRLWTLLMERGDAIGPVPAERWDTSQPLDPERDIQAVGGFLDGVDHFDAAFFGVSPREAAALDPQQRVLLEVVWRTLEDAGRRTADLAGSRTGVYVGASWHDYELLRYGRGARPTPHSLYGNALDVIAARLSYFLKLRGPSMTVETGCSSSLVALHLAAQALRSGEVEGAVVGGVNLMLDPHVTIGLTHFGGLSPDGRCQAFAASANGFVRGEGVAAVYLKTLSRARADGDRIHGVVVRTVVNNDGGGDSLVTPSPDGQEDLLRQAYGTGAVPEGQPVYIEAHGTGTGRGDPIEATALGRILGRHRAPGNPLYIGSIKTNIGHLEASAGMAGLFKLLLALRHRTVPPSLHSAELNPAIPFDELNVRVVREPLALPTEGPLYLGVNSFGWGGTNAHVVLAAPEDVPAEPPAVPDTGLPALVTVSARETAVLAERARALTAAVPDDPAALRDLAGTLAWRRDHFPVRAALVAGTPDELRTALTALAENPDGEGTGRAVPRGRTAFVFPGQGSQWDGMGRELYRDSPLFAATVTRCAEALRPHVDWDLLDIFAGRAGDEWTTRIDMLQPVLWAMSLGLAELWRACGVEPDVVLGHSQGEITAATLAGILSYEDAALVMARRSAIARLTSGQGRMLAVDLDRDAALAALEGFEDSISLAVHNGPSSCVLSGEKEAVLTLKELLEAEGTYCRLVNVDYASHSPQMDPLREDLLTALAPARPRPGTVRLMSTVRVAPLDGPEMDAAYWVENLRSPVLFSDTMRALLDDGVTHVVEISPHPVLAPAVGQLTADRTEPVAVLTTMRRHHGGTADFAEALAAAYASGLEPFGGLPRTALLPVPGYPLRQDRHWTADQPRGTGAARGLEPRLQPAPGDPRRWHGLLEPSVTDLPWLADHQVHGTPVLPGTAVLAAALAAVRSRTGRLPGSLEDIVFHKGTALGDGPARLAVEWTEDAAEGGALRLLALPEGAAHWEENATARAVVGDVRHHPAGLPGWTASAEPETAAELYRTWAARGLEYGPAFRTVRALAVTADGDEALGEVVLSERLRAGNRAHGLHPALWDGALQVSLALCGREAGQDAVVPTEIERVLVTGALEEPVTALWSHARRRADGRFDLHLFAGHDGLPLLSVVGLQLTPLAAGGPQGPADAALLHRIDWTELPPPAEETAAEPGRWVVCGDPVEADAIAKGLADRGAETLRTGPGETPGEATGVVFVAPGAPAGPEEQRQGLLRLAALVTACAAQPVPPRLAVVTLGAQAALPDDEPDPGAALYWGFTRVLRREHAELAPRLIDLGPADAGRGADGAAELLRGGADAEDQLALRAGRRLAARLTRGPATEPTPLPAPRTRHQPFRIDPGGTPVALTRRPPGPGEIEVETTAATAPGGPAAPWAGCAGRVVAVGDAVTGFAVGDRAAVCAPDGPASHVTVRADLARPIPEGLGDAAAAVLPVAAATAWYAVVEAARVTPGDSVLVHIGDAVGLAAAALARDLGAHVLATLTPAGVTDGVMTAEAGSDGAAAAAERGSGGVLAPAEGVTGDVAAVAQVGSGESASSGLSAGARWSAYAGAAPGSGVPAAVLESLAGVERARVRATRADAPGADGVLAPAEGGSGGDAAVAEAGSGGVVAPAEGVTGDVMAAAEGGAGESAVSGPAAGARWSAYAGAAPGSGVPAAVLEVLAGVEVFDARDPGWPRAVRSALGGRGVDVVIGRPAGAGPARAVAALAPDGRAVTLDGTRPDPAALPAGAALFTVDPRGLLQRRPERFAAALAAVWDRAATTGPLPLAPRTFAEAGGPGARSGRTPAVPAVPAVPAGPSDPSRPAEGAGPAPQAPAHPAVTPVLLGPSTVDAVAAVPMPGGTFRADGSYLITGGLGALGLSLAEHLAEHGAGALALLGRSAPGPEAAARIDRIRARGARVRTLRCDVSDGTALAAALDTVRAELPPLRGVVHAAGVLDDATVRNLTAAQLERVLGPKTVGAAHLDRLTADDPLDLFVLFSSAAGLVGNAGQAAYAAANTGLDALAEARRRRGVPALSVQWGPFDDIGLAASEETRGARLGERGMGGISAEQAWGALTRMLAGDRPVVGYVPIDLRQWFDAYPDTAALASWQRLRAAAGDGGSGTAADGEFLSRLLAARPADRTAIAAGRIRELAGRVLRLDADRIEAGTPFKSLGLDSLMSLELRNRLEAAFGTRLSPTLLWAYGTTKALAEHLCAQLEPAAEADLA